MLDLAKWTSPPHQMMNLVGRNAYISYIIMPQVILFPIKNTYEKNYIFIYTHIYTHFIVYFVCFISCKKLSKL